MLEIVNLILSISRPGSIIITILMYTLSVGIADYLGTPIDWLVYWIGLICCILMLLSSQWLDAFFKLVDKNQLNIFNEQLVNTKLTITPQAFRRLILQIAVTTMTCGAALSVLLIAQGAIGPVALIFLGISFITSIILAVPPFHLSQAGTGELIETILVINLLPVVGFVLQYGEMHRLLLMLTLPFTGLMLAMRLAVSLQSYSEDMRNGHKNMMISLGWERGMNLHNYSILFSFVIMALTYVFGLPWRLVWPGLLSLPIGLYQILQMRQIASGLKPNWKVLSFTAISLVGLTAYLITLTLWIG